MIRTTSTPHVLAAPDVGVSTGRLDSEPACFGVGGCGLLLDKEN